MTLRSAAVLFLCIPVFLSAQEEASLDVRLFRNINNRQTEGYGFIEFVDQSSLPFFFSIPAGFLLYGALGDNRLALDSGVLLLTSQMLTLGTTSVLKVAVNRPRPFEVLQEVKVKRLSQVSGSSFPSGHTSHAFAIATMLAFRSKPSVYVPALVWAGLVGYGRIYVGAHYPTDVLGGMVTGVLLSAIVYAYRNDVIKAKDRLFNTAPEHAQRIQDWSDNQPLLSIRIPL